MSKIGQAPIALTAGVTFQNENRLVTISGPKGKGSLKLPPQIEVELKDGNIIVTRQSEAKTAKASHGAVRAQLANLVTGVVTPWVKNLEIRGTGYKFTVAGSKLTVLAGFIHPVYVTAPEGVVFNSPDESKLNISGCDKIVVGQVASNIRKIRKPEPYKGKGIRYLNEHIKLKAGKAAKAAA